MPVERKNRSFKDTVVWLAVSGLVLLALLFTIDGYFAVSRTNPVPAAQSVAVKAGWDQTTPRLASFKWSGGLFGGSAEAKFYGQAGDSPILLEVNLRRYPLTREWRGVGVRSYTDDERDGPAKGLQPVRSEITD
jgi:hypothetical protein